MLPSQITNRGIETYYPVLYNYFYLIQVATRRINRLDNPNSINITESNKYQSDETKF